MSILVDTNVLLRRTQPDHASHGVAVESVAQLLAAGEPVYFTLQNISEFWNVATRPIANNGFGFSVSLTLGEVEKIERLLALLPDSPAVYGEWKRLVIKHCVLGVKVHDAKLVAAMNVHGVRRILTFNVGDFARYQIEVIHPAALVP
ncbi:MAG TPA: type II toxin-antitoxin system VapC family toxin [Candidatus Acidoferrales bacterium]|jgi:predicted nucleic acid-binding protein|nr:type II toxin-antitoxin system VapC family toxin [Candidatus Acidoferrales bacterium]